MLILGFIILFLIGRLLSLLVYQICWDNGKTGTFMKAGATFTLLSKPWPWLLHFIIVYPLAQITWDDFPILKTYAILCAILLAIGSVGRFGNADLGRCFWLDRFLIIILAFCVALSPAFLYPLLLATCSLQYTVASWKLSPGYSNLLGFEWIRASTCVMLAPLVAYGLTKGFGFKLDNIESLTLAVVICFQASTYINHALAKASLGKHWYSWMLENRVDCLVANSWLRGWQIHLSKTNVLRFAKWIRSWRIPICITIWSIEFAWLFFLSDPRVATIVISATILMHIAVFILTGLASYHYLASHYFILALVLCDDNHELFNSSYFIGSIIAATAYAIWLGWLRPKIFIAYQETRQIPKLTCIVDAADHLMAWWDSPYMRMFTYTVETASGETFHVPTTKLSPYDTALTDIHTHLMILGLHADLDPLVEEERKNIRTGVWGLVIDHDHKSKLYEMMDRHMEPDCLVTQSPQSPWLMKWDDQSPTSAVPIRNLFLSIQKGWFKKMLNWPHFPGEDLALDWCPLADLPNRAFHFNEPISKVTIWRIKTWYSGSEMKVIDSKPVGVIQLSDISK